MNKKNKFISIFREVYGEDEILYNENLFKKGFDSLMMAQAIGQILEVFSEEIEISFQELLEIALNNPYIDYIYKASFPDKENTESNDNLNKGEFESQDYNIQKYILCTDYDKYKEIIQLLEERGKAKIVKKVVLNNFNSSNISVLIGFGDSCKEVLEIAKKYSLNNNPIKQVIIVDPSAEINREVYLGKVVVFVKEYNNDNYEGLINKKTEIYTEDVSQLIIKYLENE